MESERTQPGSGGPHPTIAELRNPSPNIDDHIASCPMCRSAAAAMEDPPIPLDLPKGLCTEAAFRWPADPLARGGMAQVFAGEDKRLNRTVILKAPRDDEGLPAGMVEMFQQRVTAEARVLAKLQHPGIVKIYELGKSTVGWPFCVLERVDGVSLRDRLDELAELEQDGKPRTRERLELLANLVGIAEALAYAHEHHVVHRDVTPNNILLGKRGEATLIDWGIARDLDAPFGSTPEPMLDHDAEAASSGRMVTISAGTPPYMPLEQSQGRRADPSFDVYSFGITLYETVSGRTPFNWRTAKSVGGRTAQIDAFVAWLQSDDPVVPAMPKDPELSGIVERAISKDPARRFSADQLVRALKQYLTGDLVFSHRYSVSGRIARWAGRHRGATATLVFIVLGAIAGVLVWLQLSRQAREEADLRALAANAQVDASEKGRAADAAQREADSANTRAQQAEREGKDADQLKQDADRKRHAADQMRRQAQAAAQEAKGTADEALKRFEAAMRDKEDAETQRDAANLDRDTARTQAMQADKERDAARAAERTAEQDDAAARAGRDAADKERDAARTSQTAAEKERDASHASQTAAEKERDAATAARAVIEKERDELKQKLDKLAGGHKREPAPATDTAPVTAPAP
ncbi:MAG TPA: protein kinase [Kofleriaceae bacterium]|nr:protein kinase [Kofleriaceae bacterium]